MYTLSLEVVNKCNLNCSYCYLGEKKNTSMSIDTAKKAIEIAVHEVQKQYDKTLVIYFIGGEPLIAFNVIYEIVAYTKSRCMEMNLKYMFSITTNGTLLTKKIIDFFIKDKFEIKLSLDGS
ncbi:(4Fe-4S)-binding protein, partial [Lachnotalea glycerini]